MNGHGYPNSILYPTLLPNSTSRDYCYAARTQSTLLQSLPFRGVPVVLCLSIICGLGMLVVFSFFRKKFWDYGRLALMSENDSMDSASTSDTPEGDEQPTPAPSSVDIDPRDKGFWSWLTAIFRITNDDIREKCGEDAVYYLSFQWHIIILLAAITIFSLGSILPINLSGSQFKTKNNIHSFGETTIANLDGNNPVLWVHICFGILYVLLTALIMGWHESKLPYKEDDLVKRTLFLDGIPKDAQESEIKQHFESAYKNCVVVKVQILYDVARLMFLSSERKKAARCKKYYLDLKARKNVTTMINPKPFRNFFSWFFKDCQKEEAVSYYTKLEAQLDDEYRKETEKMKPLGMAIITFQNESMAAEILKDFKASKSWFFQRGRKPKSSQFSAKLNTHSWTVSYAPDPQNIQWENLSVKGVLWWLRWLIFNMALFIALYFLTTPAGIIALMDKIYILKFLEYLNNPILMQFARTVLMWFFQTLLPTIVFYSTFIERFWNRSAASRSTMLKCFIFQIIMILVLPSLGLTSLDIFFHWLFHENFFVDADIRFKCLFLPDSGAHFVNFVITAGLIGNAAELLRLCYLFTYIVRRFLARSEAERRNIKRQQAYEFPFGAAYAWMMCIVTVVMAYSITCPIIAPLGLIYMLLKHYADKYNMYYSYLPTKLDKRIHTDATKQALGAPILCLFWLLLFSTAQLGWLAVKSMFILAVLVVTICFYVWHCFGYLKYLCPFNNKIDSKIEDIEKRPADGTSASGNTEESYVVEDECQESSTINGL